MTILLAVLLGFCVDLILGDPRWMPHPVVYMGKAITRLERLLRRLLPDTPRALFWGGVVLAAVLPLGTLAFSAGVIWLAGRIHPALGFAVQVLWCWQALAVKDLRVETMHVYEPLCKGDLLAARKAVSRVVGRDTQSLTSEGVTRAAVETIAENFSDGVIAPMLYLLIGGAPLGLAYKAINTMDSMVGYKNDKYLYFGRAAAKLDDAAGYIPARLSALFWIAAAFFTGGNAANAWRIWRRDRRKHASPNAAQPESACAGALGVQLAGPAWYFGKLHEKPTLGDALRPVEVEDIPRTNRMMLTASLLGLVVLAAVRWAVLLAL